MNQPDPLRHRPLPPPPSDFVNRLEDRAAVERFLIQDLVRDLIITGEKEIGKSSFGSMLPEWIGQRFPDGPIFADLSGDPVTVMQSVLIGLGVDPRALESDPDALREQYRMKTEGGAYFAIVDNAPSPAAAEYFRPGKGRSLLVVLTRDWPNDPTIARRELGPLSPEYAAEMLMKGCTDLSKADADTAIGGRWWSPGKVRAAVVNIKALREYHAAERQRMISFATADTAEINESTRSTLDRTADWLYGLLLQLEGGEFEAAMLDGVDPRLQGSLEALERVEFVERLDPEGRRYQVRGATSPDAPLPQYTSALGDLLRCTLTRAQSADLRLRPERLRISDYRHADPDAFHDEAAAMDWLRDNRVLLTGLVRIAPRLGLHAKGCALAEAMWPMFNSLPFPMQAIDCYRAALDAAAGDPLATARIQVFLGRKLIDIKDFEASDAMLYEAARVALELDREDLALAADEQIVYSHLEQGQYGKAAASATSGLRRAEGLGRERARTLFLKHLGAAYLGLEDTGRARECFVRLLDRCGEDNPRDRAIAVFELAALRILRGDRKAVAEAEEAVGELRRLGSVQDAISRIVRGVLMLEGTDRERWIRFGLPICEEYGSLEAERLRRMLD